jgi:hypothetical protein
MIGGRIIVRSSLLLLLGLDFAVQSGGVVPLVLVPCACLCGARTVAGCSVPRRPWPGAWVWCCAVYIDSSGCCRRRSRRHRQRLSISVNLPLRRLGRERRNWFSGTEHLFAELCLPT